MAVFKRLFFDIPGLGRVDAKAGGSIKFSGFHRTMVNADTGPQGPEEEPVHGELKFKLPNKAGLSVKGINALKGINVTVQDDSGKTWHCSGAFSEDPPTLTNGEFNVDMLYIREEEVL